LASNDWTRFRPSLIMTEATFPQTPVRRPDQITPFLSGHGYRHVYFDGLNDYYAEAGFEIPAGVFDVPLNVFDEVKPFREVMLEQARDSLERDLELLREQQANAEAYIASLKAALDDSTQRIAEHAERIVSLTDRMQGMAVDLGRANAEITGLRLEISEMVGVGAERSGASLVEQVRHLQAQIEQLRNSTSWRVTRPLRVIAHPRRAMKIMLSRLQN
jgi:hypothetical protein